MNIRVLESIDDANENQWNNLVRQTDGGTVFHTAGWLRSIETGLGREPRHLLVEVDGNPIAVYPHVLTAVDVPSRVPAWLARHVPRRLTSVTPGYGGPLIGSKEDQVVGAMFDAIDDLGGGRVISHRIRSLDPDVVRLAQFLEQRGYRSSLLNCRIWLDLTGGSAAVREAMDKERRKEIRDAKRHEPAFHVDQFTVEEVDPFYREYEKTMSRVGGVQYPPSFFRALSRHLSESTAIFTAVLDGTVIGKHLCLLDDVRQAVHYFFNGTDKAYFEYAPSSLLHDHAIEWAVENGYRCYDLGSTNANYNNGVYRYKRKFGGQLEPIYAWERGFASPEWWAYDWLRRLYRRHTSVLDQ